MQRLHDAEAAAREIVARTGGEIRLALPLGLGKPVRLVNALVKLACDDPSIRLERHREIIATAGSCTLAC